jgi:UDP-glucose 4-epimerase
MKILFIGGTGTISAAISKLLITQGHDLYLLNRGKRNEVFGESVQAWVADVNDEARVAALIKDRNFDCVVDFIAFVPEHLKRDYRLFGDKFLSVDKWCDDLIEKRERIIKEYLQK